MLAIVDQNGFPLLSRARQGVPVPSVTTMGLMGAFYQAGADKHCRVRMLHSPHADVAFSSNGDGLLLALALPRSSLTQAAAEEYTQRVLSAALSAVSFVVDAEALLSGARARRAAAAATGAVDRILNGFPAAPCRTPVPAAVREDMLLRLRSFGSGSDGCPPAVGRWLLSGDRVALSEPPGLDLPVEALVASLQGTEGQLVPLSEGSLAVYRLEQGWTLAVLSAASSSSSSSSSPSSSSSSPSSSSPSLDLAAAEAAFERCALPEPIAPPRQCKAVLLSTHSPDGVALRRFVGDDGLEAVLDTWLEAARPVLHVHSGAQEVVGCLAGGEAVVALRVRGVLAAVYVVKSVGSSGSGVSSGSVGGGGGGQRRREAGKRAKAAVLECLASSAFH